jgi:hypothetical protein
MDTHARDRDLPRGETPQCSPRDDALIAHTKAPGSCNPAYAIAYKGAATRYRS